MNKTITSILVGGGIVAGAIGGVTLDSNQVIIIAPELDQQQKYIANEIANDRVPQLNLSNIPPSEVTKAQLDYVVVADYLGADMQQVIDYCLKNRDPEQCNLYNRVKSQIKLQVNELKQ